MHFSIVLKNMPCSCGVILFIY